MEDHRNEEDTSGGWAMTGSYTMQNDENRRVSPRDEHHQRYAYGFVGAAAVVLCAHHAQRPDPRHERARD